MMDAVEMAFCGMMYILSCMKNDHACKQYEGTDSEIWKAVMFLLPIGRIYEFRC
jgi:hypothetical protein